MVMDREKSGSGDTVQMYLREIGRVPLLSAAQEITLARRIQRGDKHARLDMIRANLRLVVKIAHDYEGLGLPLSDLISEGNIGLMRAVERFDLKKGAKLSTYAAWWIKQGIRRALANQSKTIRLPVHVADKLSRLRRASYRLVETLGREPTDAELADRLQLPAFKVSHLRTLGVRPASLEAPIHGEGDEDATPFSDMVTDADALAPDQLLRVKARRQDLREQLQHLTAREADIIRLRFGLSGDDPLTLEEVGRIYKVSRERVRQVQDMALTKLRRRLEMLEEAHGPQESGDTGP